MAINKETIKQSTTQGLGIEIPEQTAFKEVVVDESIIPFVGRDLKGKTLWKIDVSGVRSHLENAPNRMAFGNLDNVSVYLAPDTGIVMKVISEWPENEPRAAEYPSLIEVERQLQGRDEDYLGLPSVPPAIPFFKALKIINIQAPGALETTKQVIGYYISHKTLYYSGKNVWVIETRGIEPIPVAFADKARVVKGARDHLRHIVDADSGTWLFSDTVPQPL